MDNSVKALLDKLKSSHAWQQTVASSESDPPAPASAESRSDPDVRPSVASLLAQLAGTSSGHSPLPSALAEPSNPSAPSDVSIGHSLHAFSFQQTLAHLAQLSDKPGFVESIRRIQKEQSALESQLWDERLAIQHKHQERVNVAVNKANLIGSGGLSQFEADALTQAYKKELQKFDTQRAIVAWDGLMSKQQAGLESLEVPGIYVSHLTLDTEKQQRVVRVLESIVNGPD